MAALQAALPQTVPDAATLQPDPLTVSIAQAIHEPPLAHLPDPTSSDAVVAAPPEPTEAPVPVDAVLSQAPVSDAIAVSEEPEAAPVIAAEPIVEAAPMIEAAPVIQAAPVIEAAPASDTVAEPAESSAPRIQPPAASDPYANVVPLKAPAPVVARLPEPAAVAAEPDAPPASGSALPAPASWRAGRRPVPPLRQDLEGMGETLFAFVRNESTAALAHLNALKDVRSPADAIRLQVSEIQRAADASLTCWSEIARRATRLVAQR